MEIKILNTEQPAPKKGEKTTPNTLFVKQLNREEITFWVSDENGFALPLKRFYPGDFIKDFQKFAQSVVRSVNGQRPDKFGNVTVNIPEVNVEEITNTVINSDNFINSVKEKLNAWVKEELMENTKNDIIRELKGE